MNQLIAVYLLTSTIQVLPVALVTVGLLYGLPFPFSPHMINDRTRIDGGLRNIGISRQAFQLFDSDTINNVARFSFTAAMIQAATAGFIGLAMYYDISLPCIGNININGRLKEDTLLDLLSFTLTTSVLQFLPVLFLFLAFAYDIPLPFLTSAPQTREPSIPGWDEQSQVYVLTRLIRLQNARRTVIFAKLRNDRRGFAVKAIFSQENDVGARTECYLYNYLDRVWEPIIPAPIGINELEEIFNFENN